jgi:hypothetical protein
VFLLVVSGGLVWWGVCGTWCGVCVPTIVLTGCIIPACVHAGQVAWCGGVVHPSDWEYSCSMKNSWY